MIRHGLLACSFACLVSLLAANSIASDSQSGVSLVGMIDMHIHTAPDTRPRSLDDIRAAQMAHDAGMRAIVLKNHEFQTAVRAQLANQGVSGIDVFGGIALNLASGGLNAHAVDAMARLEGGRGKIVWLPTRTMVEVPVLDGKGVVLPGLEALLKVVAQHDLVLATGHIPPAESLVVIKAAHDVGVQRILVTHALSPSVGMDLEQMRALTAHGALIELVYLPTITNPVLFDTYTEAIREVGAQHFVLATDLGQAENPLPADGLRHLLYELAQRGVSGTEFDLMLRKNPAFLLGLPWAPRQE